MSYDFDLAGKVALVTGASSGLGLRAAKALGEQGARVVLAARRREIIEEVAKQIVDAGGRAYAVSLDVSNIADVRAAAEHIKRTVGPIDILVNNAGVSRQVLLDDVDETYFDWIFNTNVRGAFFVAQSVARQMVKHKIEGRIINIASVAAAAAFPNLTVYGMSKAAVAQMTRALALELAPHGINVNCIAPGYIPTGISPNFPNTAGGKFMIGNLPRHRGGVPEDLDAALLMFCSVTRSRLITGTVLPVDDGYWVI